MAGEQGPLTGLLAADEGLGVTWHFRAPGVGNDPWEPVEVLLDTGSDPHSVVSVEVRDRVQAAAPGAVQPLAEAVAITLGDGREVHARECVTLSLRLEDALFGGSPVILEVRGLVFPGVSGVVLGIETLREHRELQAVLFKGLMSLENMDWLVDQLRGATDTSGPGHMDVTGEPTGGPARGSTVVDA